MLGSGQILFNVKSKVTKEVHNTRRKYRKFLDHITHTPTNYLCDRPKYFKENVFVF